LKLYPAIDVQSSSDLVLALVDDFSPSAIEQTDSAMRVFFASLQARDAACAELRSAGYHATPLDVSDEDWARRSQDNLKPVTIGRITIAPPWAASPTAGPSDSSRELLGPSSKPQVPKPLFTIVIEPSMGFGTGHHATTQLCLEALQGLDLANSFVLDVGTGSGVLAIAADLLGCRRALGIDNDSDAIQSARENLALNPGATHTSFDIVDLTATRLPIADVLTANLTGALLARSAPTLLGAVRAGGTLVLSGILETEAAAVRDAFADAQVLWRRQETEWIGLALRKR
jgi:ribosomal protein L11 methyltransferase